MTVELGSMANGGGLVLDTLPSGRPALRCPAAGCGWYAEVTDLGEFVDLGLSEDVVRAHLATHPVQDWLRTISANHGTIRGLMQRVTAGDERLRRFREDAAFREVTLAQQRDDLARRLYDATGGDGDDRGNG